jgi:hypothetical protein
MKEHQAKKQLKKMLRSLTAGSVLHLLAEIMSESANEAKRKNDLASRRQFKLVEDTLFVVGLGIDAANPQ